MKKLFPLFLVLLVSFLLIINVSAHSGKTDESGGHNSEDGYHYHHGWPAHGHWDMDYDGDIDCLYDFVDNTGINSGTGGSGGNSNVYDPDDCNYNEGYADGYGAGEAFAKKSLEEKHKQALSENTSSTTISTIFYVLLLGIPLALWLIHKKSRQYRTEIDNINKKHKEQITRLNQEHTADINARIQQIEQLKQEHDKDINDRILRHIIPGRAEYVHLPEDVKLNLSCVPIKGKATKLRPFGDYTVYISEKGGKYHATRGCSKAKKPKLVFDCITTMESCTICESHLNTRSIPIWYKEIINHIELDNNSQ